MKLWVIGTIVFLTPSLRLLNQTASQCVMLPMIDEDEQKTFLDCKNGLAQKVLEKCEGISVEDAGRLLYCKRRDFMKCCFRALQIL